MGIWVVYDPLETCLSPLCRIWSHWSNCTGVGSGGRWGPFRMWGGAWLTPKTRPSRATVPNLTAEGQTAPSYPVFQGHSRSSKPIRIDQLPMTSC